MCTAELWYFNTRANQIKSWGYYKRGVWGLRFGGAVLTVNLLPCEWCELEIGYRRNHHGMSLKPGSPLWLNDISRTV